MKVSLKLYAMLADHLPAGSKNNRVELDVGESATVDAVIQQFSLPARLVHLVLVNGTYVPAEARAETVLKENDTLAIWPPIAGG